MRISTHKSEKSEKKPYVAPKLTRYGKVSELTAGGTGSANENSMGGAKKP